MESSPVKLLQQIRRRVQSVTYGSPIYRMMLDQGPVPERLRLSIPDLWPGDAKAGQELIASQPSLFEQDAALPEDKRMAFLSFECLRDLRAVGSDLARRKTIALIHEWMDNQEEWNEENWAPDILGARLANWIAFYDFYGAAASHDFTRNIIGCMVRQLRHLLHVTPTSLNGVPALYVIKGLLYGGLALIEGERALGLALDLLRRQLDEEVLPDGGTVFRNPQMHATMLRHLIDIRGALRAAQMEVPQELSLAISRMVPALKFFRHGDGGLALFNGGREDSWLMMDAVQSLAQVRGRVLKRLSHMGYERMTAGRSLLMIDVGAPPSYPFDGCAHAGLMSFEFSVGKERVITNCGAPQTSDPAWRLALAATAAHNTVTVEDTNACQIVPEGGIGHRPRHVTSQRYEQEGEQCVEITHDGYRQRQKLMVHRTLSLSADGDILSGTDTLTGPAGRNFTVRWHVHPEVNVMLSQGGDSALLRTQTGGGWRFRVRGATGESLGLEASVYCGNGPARRTLQLKISGRTQDTSTLIDWSLKREKTKKGGKE